MHGGAGAAEANADQKVRWRRRPSLEGDLIEVEADIGRFGDVTVKDGGGWIRFRIGWFGTGGGSRAKINDTKGELMDGFRNATEEAVLGGAEHGKKSLGGKSAEEGGNRNTNQA